MSDPMARSPRIRSAIGKQGAWRTLLSHLLIVILPLVGLYVFYVQRQDENEIDRSFRTLQEAGKRFENDLRSLNAWRMPNASYQLLKTLGLQQVDYEPLSAEHEARAWQQKQALAAKAFLEALADADNSLRQAFIEALKEKRKALLGVKELPENGGHYSKASLRIAKQQADEILRIYEKGLPDEIATHKVNGLKKAYDNLIRACEDKTICLADAVLQGRWLAFNTKQQQIKLSQHRIAALSFLTTVPVEHAKLCEAIPLRDGAIAFESSSTGGAAFAFPCDNGRLVQAFAIKADARQLFQGITTGMQFDEFLLADADGHLLFSPLMGAAPRVTGDRTGYQPFAEQADVVALRALLQEAARKERHELKQLNIPGDKTEVLKNEGVPDATTLLNAEIGGRRYRVYIQPYRVAIPLAVAPDKLLAATNGGTASPAATPKEGDGETNAGATTTLTHTDDQITLYLVGLRHHQPIKSVAPDTPFAASFIVIMVAAILLAVPFIKLYFLDHDDPLPRSLLPMLMLALPGAAAGLMLIGEVALLHQAERSRLIDIAKSNAEALTQSFSIELSEALQQIKSIASDEQRKQRWQTDCHDLSGNPSRGDAITGRECPQIRLRPIADPGTAESPQKTTPAFPLPWVGTIAEANDNGVITKRWFFREPMANRHGSSVANREYFRHLRDGRAFDAGGVLLPHVATGQLFDIQRVINYSDGRNTTQLSVRKNRDDFSAGLLTAEMQDLTLLAPVLPAGFRYSVFDNSTGIVLFDSSSRRELTESIYDKLSDAQRLRALIHRRTSQGFDSDYHGRPTLFYAQPMPSDIPWTLLVYYDRIPGQQRLMVALRIAALAFVIYGLALIVCVYWLPRFKSGRDLWRWPMGQHRLRFTWAWPQWRLRHAYVDYRLALYLQLLFCLITVFCVEMAGWQALLFCFGQAALALGSGVLLLQCLHHRRPIPIDVVQRPLLTGAAVALTWLLLLIAVGWYGWSVLIALLHLLWIGLVFQHASPHARLLHRQTAKGPTQRGTALLQTLARRGLIAHRRYWLRDSRLSQSKYERRYLSCALLVTLLIAVAPAHLFLNQSLQVQQRQKLAEDLLTLTDQLDRRTRALATKTRLLEPTCSQRSDFLLSMPSTHDFGVSGAQRHHVVPAQVSSHEATDCGNTSIVSPSQHRLHYLDTPEAGEAENAALWIRAERSNLHSPTSQSSISGDAHMTDWFSLLASLLQLDSWLGAMADSSDLDSDLGNGWRKTGMSTVTATTKEPVPVMPCEAMDIRVNCVSLAMTSQRYAYIQALVAPSRFAAAVTFIATILAVVWLLARLTAVQYAGLHRSRARYQTPRMTARRPRHYVLMQPMLMQRSWHDFARARHFECCSVSDELPRSGTVLVTGFETQFADAKTREVLLSRLETTMANDSPLRICLIIDFQPLYRLFSPEHYPETSDADAVTLSAFEQARWARLLAGCEPINHIDELPDYIQPDILPDPTGLSESGLIGRLIRRECRLFEPELHWIQHALLIRHHTCVLTEDEVFRFVARKASFIYRHKWEQCSISERLALYHITCGCDLNPATRSISENLLRRGYIRAEPSLQITNRSFAEFVVNAETPYQFEQWAELRPHGLWRSIRVPILLLLVMLLAWVAWTAGSTFSTVTVILGGVLGLMTQVMNGLSLMRSQFGGGQPASK